MYDGKPDCTSCQEKPVEPLLGNYNAIRLFTVIVNNGGNFDFQNLLSSASVYPGITIDDLQRVVEILATEYRVVINTRGNK